MYSLFIITSIAAMAADPQPIDAPSPDLGWGYQSAWIGSAWEEARQDPSASPAAFLDAPLSIDLAARSVSTGPWLRGSGVSQRVRLSRDADGRTLIDEASLQARVFGLAIRPAAGDLLELTLFGGRWEQNVYGLARPWTTLAVFVPLRLVPLGFSDTDVDDERALRYFAAAGGGLGADWLVRLAGPIGVHVRAEGGAETLRRLRPDAPDQARHEVWGRGELDLALHNTSGWITIGVYADYRAQWDALVGSGITRSIGSGGLRVGVRLPQAGRERGPDVGPGPLPRGHRATNTRNQGPSARTDRATEPSPPTPPAPSAEEHATLNEQNEGAPAED